MIRDIIPFLFMMLPLFLAAFFRAQDKRFLILQRALVITGIVLSVRALAEHVQVLASFLLLSPPAELTYLANAPTILFAALLIAGTGAQKFIGVSPSLKSALTGAARMTLALFVFLPVAMTLQRAGIGYALLFAAVLAALGVKQAPYRTLMLAGILALLLAPLYGAVTALMEMAMAKTGRVGFNMRFEEIAAVWHEISAELPSFLFGRGWGAEFASPAVGGIRVNYTHGLLSSALLKTGLAGFALTLLYLAPILRGLAAHIRTRPVLVLALAGPILIDLFFYASFKSLDFGLVLLLAAAIPPASSSRILEVAKPD